MEAVLVQCVQSSIRHFMYNNAIFVCERLCAEFPSEINLQLLAGCYLHNHQPYSAYHILKGTQMAQSRYLFALSCFQMDLLNEAESALCPANDPGAEVPNGAAGHYLLGLIYRYTDRRNRAVRHFKQALSIDPLLWAAYEELCILGNAEETSKVFSEASAICIQKQLLSDGFPSQHFHTSSEDCNLTSARTLGLDDINSRQQKRADCNNLRDSTGKYHVVTTSGASVHPVNGSSSLSSNLSFYSTPPIAAQLSAVAPPPLYRNMRPTSHAISAESSPKSTLKSTIQAPRRKIFDEGKLRKVSERLFFDSGPRRSSRLAEDAGSNTTTTILGGNGKCYSSENVGSVKLSSGTFRSTVVRKGQSLATENLDEGICPKAFDESRPNNTFGVSVSSRFDDTRSLVYGSNLPMAVVSSHCSWLLSGISDILGLFRVLGEAYKLSCLYRCQDALNVYLKLPHQQYNTAWVLSQVGKAYFEMVDYLEADRAFSLARRASPYSLEGMDIYSTVLYHLKEDMKLSYLAQELVATDRLAPQSWCAMGNCFSLQKDHETALKNFQRAVQLNSRFTYAHTLCGHEYIALEDFDNGIKCYQSALQIDARHYNSWHGLGMVCLRQERFDFAEHHFRMACQINSRSSVILSYLGTALHALKRTSEALDLMDKAILADRKNPLPLYQKANILVSLGNFDEALDILEELKEHTPCESSVYALMGKIYKRRNMYDKAMLYFGLALDLKPSAADVATIKAAIEKLHVPHELEDEL